MSLKTQKHAYHIVEPSAWPIVTALASFVFATGMVFYVHGYGQVLLWMGVVFLFLVAAGWWRDVIREALDNHHTGIVQQGIRFGMVFFIVSEFMFFFAFFWSFFDASLFPDKAIGGVWPPKNIEPIDPFHLPYVNTLILLLSATSLTWAHEAVKHVGQNKAVLQGLLITVCLGLIFSCVQAMEYVHAAFTLKDGIYGSNFYMLTGFHGVHVIIGTLFLGVCFFRAMQQQFKTDHHLGLDAAAWYWHFVDVVWLFLFVFVYWWGS